VDCSEGTAVRLHHRGVNQTHIILYISFIITYSFFVIPAKAGIQSKPEGQGPTGLPVGECRDNDMK
jgi:hypothetical protein